MPKYPKPKKYTSKKISRQEATLDELELYEQWKIQVLPELRAMVLQGVSAKDIYKKFEAHAAARAVSIVIGQTANESQVLAAIKEVSDKASGKPTETKKLEHQFASLSDEQLEAVLQTRIQESPPGVIDEVLDVVPGPDDTFDEDSD